MDSASPSDGDTLFVAKQPSYLTVISRGSKQLALTLCKVSNMNVYHT